MLKTLLKKQIWALLAVFTQGKNGKRRAPLTAIGYAVLLAYGVGAVGFLFWEMSKMLCQPLVDANLAWVYFSVMSLMATAFGVIGSCFMAKSKLYEAKDNDLLLSMPIPAHTILLARMIGLYLFTFMIELLVLAPALVQYYMVAGCQIPSLIGGIVLLFVLPLGSTAICCLVGFLLAVLTARLPYKNFWSVLGFVIFMAVYFTVYSKVNEYLGYILQNGEAVGSAMKTVLYPFSQIGFAIEGNWLSLLISVGIWGGLFAVGYWVISLTYFRVITMKRGERYAKYEQRAEKQSGVVFALFKKEFLRLIKSPMYLINASMGTFFMLILGIMMIVKGDLGGLTPETLTAMIGDEKVMGLLAALAVCFLASSNTIAASSVSLEGENISLVKALPVTEWSILRSKVYLHFAMTVLPALFCGAVVSVLWGLVWWEIVIVFATAVIASLLFASFDLAVNLKFPNLQWTNEVTVIKQSMSVMIAMFGGWGVSLLPLGGYFLFGKYLPAWGYALLCMGLLTATTVGLLFWLNRKGVKIFKTLSV